eukprot:TRINITY_DN24878_c0_g2_i1.p1 TRINITY_DN24878_c0_g2~~TRINITY_DN24878_c0_g2_i1.p1  ORF type:complete len:128 (+),score=8.35 TRINITY_DN24878_c0_g2_i1:632-1015(+)
MSAIATPGRTRWHHFLYGHHSKLIFRKEVIESKKGSQQGDVEGGDLFAIGFRPLVKDISKLAGLLLKLWYHDDGYLVGTEAQLEVVLDILCSKGTVVGYFVNFKKCILVSRESISRPINLLPPRTLR